MLFKHFIQEREVAIRRSSFHWNFWKLSVKKLICNEVARCQPVSLRKKLFHTSSFMYFPFILSECDALFLPNRFPKCTSTVSFGKNKRKVVLLVIYLYNYNSFKSTFFMLNMVFFSSKLEFFVSLNIKITRTSFFRLCVLMCTF